MLAFYRVLSRTEAPGTTLLQHRSDVSAALDGGPRLDARERPAAARPALFITIGPYQAMAPEAVTPETSSNRMPCSLAWAVALSPLLKGCATTACRGRLPQVK
jgi:hypothetical protein